ncbi:3'(2'),5'-bisphosphate nucleotidase CysQ [Immundisolibacter sp.]|uniref:3'(2'),5'-bisphosphate nucleotidase CysQ n=1 Tax=Immundisolibacter sp. TaxID=1934948 RepID=UPI00261C8786|nr:3'(2'),5'-bisphosphate nucleotidase CysQ [Immundisolibacter sp.]MDD3650839.1 3'(2'),5'-bisphosphate nucleotidase CysQ [Immundisolibacter sp.]
MTARLDLPGLLPAVIDIARRAAAAILEVYEGEFAVEHKDDHSPLTAADRAAHGVIVAALEALTPQWPVLSEESVAVPYAQRRAWQRYWLVDPLDGTREFVKRNGEFTVNIALIDDGRPVLGVVQVPVRGEVYAAAAGAGALHLSASGARRTLQVATYRGGPLRVVASRSHGGPQLAKLLEALPGHRIVSIGSSLKICLVAAGEADFYPRHGPTCEWDTAAAQCVLEQAGGQLTDFDLRPLKYNKESLLNPPFLAFGAGERPWLAPLQAG